MSILIDEFITKTKESNITEGINLGDGAGTKWYIAKPLQPSLTPKKLLERIQDAWRIITGRSFAVHYMRDELDDIARKYDHR